MAYIVDIVLVAIFALVILISAQKGFFRSLFDLIGAILSFIVARIVAGSVAPVVFGSVIKPGAEKYLEASLSGVGTTDYATQIENAISSIPEALSGILQIMGVDKEYLLTRASSFNLNGDNLVESIMNTVVEPIGTAVIRFILIAVLSVVLLFVIRILVKILDKIIGKLPVINKFNSLLGGVFGALRGLIIVGILAMLISVIAGFINNEAFIQSVDNSFIVNAFDGLLASLSGISL